MSEPLDFMEALEALALPKVEQKPWMLNTHMERVTADTLDRVVDECIAAGMYSFDVETTGLDNRVFYADDGSPYTVDKTVGYCLAPSEDRGYYIPVRHRDPKTGNMAEANVPMRLVVPALQRLVNSPARAVFHNGKFDQEFLQHEVLGGVGDWDDPDKWDDTFILAYLRNTRERNKGLKHLSHVELQREMIELEELFTPEERKAGGLNFGNLDPTWEPAIWYACSDAMCTLGLRRVLYPQVVEPDEHKNEQRTLYKIEKSCVPATRWMERCRIPIDRPKVGELIRIGQREWFACLVEVYVEINKALDRDTRPKWLQVMQEHPTLRFDPESVEPSYMDARETAMAHAGGEDNRTTEKSVPMLTDPRKYETVSFPLTYDVTIPEHLGRLMRELGVRGLRATEKSGQVKTSKDELERVIEEAGDEYAYMGKIRRFREVAKALSSNLFPIWHDTSPERSPDGRIRVSFNAHKVDTGRFSTPTPRDEARFTGQVRWNLHSIPATYDKKKPECMRRMREIIRVTDDKVLYAIDYSGVELRIVTNISGEPKWVDEFFRCSECDTKFDRGQGSEPPPHFCPKCGSDKIGDLHTLTALAIYGDGAKDASDFKQKRQSSKCVHPDTLITTTRGRVRIGSLEFGDEDTFYPVSGLGVLNPAQRYVPVKETYNGGVKPLYHVVTRRGVLTCSGVHRFALADGSLKSVETGLTVGDVLPDPVGDVEQDREFPVVAYRPFEGVPPLAYQTTPDTAYFAGLHAGDGCSSVACAEITHGDVSKTDSLGVPYAEWQLAILEACVAVGLEPRAKQRGVYLGSRHVLRWMQALGMVQGNPPTKRTFRVPAWVLQAGRLAMLHYLGGLVDTDGCVSAGGDLSITTKDFVYAGQVAELFRAVGCVAAVSPSWNKTYERYYLKVSVKRKDGAILRPFMKHPGKKARIGDTTVEYNRWDNEVLLVLPAGEGPCVDLHVDSDDHLYAANGFAVHNSLNFAMCYGGGGSAAQRAVGVEKEEGWRIKNQFDKTYMGLRRWWGKQHDTARRWTYVRTAFGRKYPLPDILHTDGGFRSKAERNSVNGPVQGTSADIMKLAMVLIYREFKKRGWLHRAKAIITIHDELVFEVDGDIAEEMVDVTVPLMVEKTVAPLGWLVPLKVDIEFGQDWLVPLNLIELEHGKKPWPEKWARMFPRRSSRQPLAAPSVPTPSAPPSLAAPPSPAPVVPSTPVAPSPAPVAQAPQEGSTGAQTPGTTVEGGKCIHVIHTSRLSLGLMDKLARVIQRCEGRGTTALRIVTEAGDVLLDETSTVVKVAPGEFKAIAMYEGI